MFVPRTLAAALARDQARWLAGHRAVLVARALHALTLQVARGALWIQASGIGRALDAHPRSGVAGGVLGFAVHRVAARQEAAATLDIADATVARGVVQAVDAARISGIAGAAVAVARVDTLHAAAAGDVAARPVRRAVPIIEALDAAAAAVAGGVARLAAVAVGQALDAQIELVRAAARGLPGAVAGLRAGERASREHTVAGLIGSAVVGRAALDAGIAHARRLGAPTISVDHALDASAAGTDRTIPRAAPFRPAFEDRAVLVAEQFQPAPLVEIAT